MSSNYPVINKATDQGAIDVLTDTSSFTNILSSSDIDVQKALDTLDENIHRFVQTSITESINITSGAIIQQTTSSITTSLSGESVGMIVTIDNSSGGNNTLDITLDGVGSPILGSNEAITMYYDGTEWRGI